MHSAGNTGLFLKNTSPFLTDPLQVSLAPRLQPGEKGTEQALAVSTAFPARREAVKTAVVVIAASPG
jgi:hypothetical protein